MTTTMVATLGMAGSYNLNSRPQMAAIEASLPFIREGIDVLDISSSSTPLIIADFGAAHGLNSMYAMKTIIQYLKESKKIDDNKQIIVIHNDLPTNDWTSLFELLNKDNLYFGVANGRSFYEPCLPSNSFAIGYSSAAIHWLSRKPCNLSNHCSFQFAQGDELIMYQKQARLDLAQFIEQRSRELQLGGVLILSIVGVDEQGFVGSEKTLDALYKCAQSLLEQQELLDYTIPIYNRSLNECIDHELFDRCSLKLIKSAPKKTRAPFYDQYLDGKMTLDDFARTRTQIMRSYTESPLRQALEINGRSKEDVENVLTHFWSMYEQEVKTTPSDHDSAMFCIYLILKKC
ncbi:unnamed protein product [Adineta steineri]|uniref:Uncharacterized protein n=1 Tax=Adineta steineri TaxID=433720 RepID=A0A814JHJ3_9BILA|nr:unnamed protein product [Adineta steineri]